TQDQREARDQQRDGPNAHPQHPLHGAEGLRTDQLARQRGSEIPPRAAELVDRVELIDGLVVARERRISRLQTELPERLAPDVTGLADVEPVVAVDDALHVLRIDYETAVLAEYRVARARNI